MSKSLLGSIVRLAHTVPEMQPHLMPLIRQAQHPRKAVMFFPPSPTDTLAEYVGQFFQLAFKTQAQKVTTTFPDVGVVMLEIEDQALNGDRVTIMVQMGPKLAFTSTRSMTTGVGAVTLEYQTGWVKLLGMAPNRAGALLGHHLLHPFV